MMAPRALEGTELTVPQTVMLITETPVLEAIASFTTAAPPLIADILAFGDSLIGSLLAQGDAVAPSADAATKPAGDAVKGEQSFLEHVLTNPIYMMIGLFFIFYLTFLGPERRRKNEEAQRMSALKKNDRIITVGGIHGVIVSAAPESDVVTLRIDENGNTRIKINRSAIASVVNQTKDSTNSTDKQAVPDAKD